VPNLVLLISPQKLTFAVCAVEEETVFSLISYSILLCSLYEDRRISKHIVLRPFAVRLYVCFLNMFLKLCGAF
jgi:hypothetical protein